MYSKNENRNSLTLREKEDNTANANNIAINIQNISKCYQIYDQPHDRLKQTIYPRLQRVVGQTPKQYYREFWALKDISFTVKKGETVGIIGRNGSGKSTLLQIICGTLAQTIGKIETKGRIAVLLELGSGFNPEFTGRENVYMNGAILGLSPQEIDSRFDDILAFADIGEFIEQPIKTYSSGMYVRLAFAVNILSDPEIMVVDEALAVGDMRFQAKCMTALTRIQDRGTAVLFVSHDINALKSLCSRGVYIDHGTIQSIGKAPDVAEQYIRTMREEINLECNNFSSTLSSSSKEHSEIREYSLESKRKHTEVLKRSDEFDKKMASFRYGSGGAKITYVELLNLNDDPVLSVKFNQKVKIRIYLEASIKKLISVNFNVLDDKKINIIGCGFLQAECDLLNTEDGGLYIIEYLVRLPLQEGQYSLSALITSPVESGDQADFLDVIEDAVMFQMERWVKARIWSKTHLFPSVSVERLD